MSANIDTVRASYDAFHRKDLQGVLAALAPDVSWIHPDGLKDFGLGGVKKGHDDVVAFIRHVPEYISEMKLHPHEFIEQDDRIVVFGTRDVTAANGRSATLRFVHSWKFVDGKAKEFEDYFDTAEFVRLISD